VAETPQSQPWYHAAFGEDYLARYAHRDDAEAAHAVALLTANAGLATGAAVLDLCCGAGRHLAHLGRAGLAAVGGDLSEKLLAVAKVNAGRPLARLDMRHLPFAAESFDLVANFFTAFGYFHGDAENFAVFAEVHRVLRPGGCFALDFLNAEAVRRQLAEMPPEEVMECDGGDAWVISRGLSADGRRAEKHQWLLRGGRCVRSFQESVRLFSPAEIDAALESRGFAITHRWGNYAGDAFDAEASSRYFVMARKEGSGE